MPSTTGDGVQARSGKAAAPAAGEGAEQRGDEDEHRRNPRSSRRGGCAAGASGMRRRRQCAKRSIVPIRKGSSAVKSTSSIAHPG